MPSLNCSSLSEVIIWEKPRTVLHGESGWQTSHQSRLSPPPPLKSLYVGCVPIDLNLTSRVHYGNFGLLSHQLMPACGMI